MPNWGEHLLVANKLVKKIKVDENLFLFGNILPDVQDGYLVKDISNIISHKINHYDVQGKKWGYENFYDIYSKKLNNPIMLGYLAHLMTDFSWNQMFYDGKCVKENNEIIGYINKTGKLIKKSKSEARLDKQKEFEIYQYYIYKNHDIKLPEYNKEIVLNADMIENININDDDVKKVVNYIKDTKLNSKDKNEELEIFTIEELENQIDKTVNFIYDFLKNKFL